MEGKTLESTARGSRLSMHPGWMVFQALLGFGLATTGMAAPVVRADPHGLRMDSYRVERDVTPGRNKVVGTLTNVSRKRVHTARISFRLYDVHWRVIGRAVAEVHDIDPGQTWKFHAGARGNVSRARLIRIDTE
ncbi:FxLYD domain-containing protein [Dyella sp. C9]|uniref:FxLYD domain-containing protein n=1 Tax=Dyella sp. C9 TaxID=2202154 RepID=UPI000DEFC548|nr:FxLYD domain-containing protein [Dyella sp. C9]